MAKKGEQVAALPWRVRDDGSVEVLLVTSRETGRWVIPKGWPMKGRKDREAAAIEAFEEAGLEGRVSRKHVGQYPYVKRLKNGRDVPIVVKVYALKVDMEADAFPEGGQRRREWVPTVEAARMVNEPELGELIEGFGRVAMPEERSVPGP